MARRADRTGWTIDMLAEHMQFQIDELRRLLDERYATQTKALDAAFASAERAVQTAREAQDRATQKAEIATEKRFESVNEFRAQLTDQAATFMSRSESDARRADYNSRIAALAEKLEAETSRIAEVEIRLTSRMDLNQGRDIGALTLTAQRRASASQVVAIVSVVLVAVSVAVAIILGFNN